MTTGIGALAGTQQSNTNINATSASPTDALANESTFLKLLVTQLKNQAAPFDLNEFTKETA